MKRIIAVLTMASVLAGVAVAEDVTSVNAVGFIKTTIADGGWTMIAMPLSRTDGGATMIISDILSDPPVTTRAYFWRNNMWMFEEYEDFSFAWAPGTNEFIRGDALFIRAPLSGGPHTYTVAGEVPSVDTAPSDTVVIAAGWTLAGFSYPVDMPVTNTTLASVVTPGDRLYYWDTDHWSYAEYEDFSFEWNPVDFVLQAGQGYFFSSSAGFDWTETKPYVWP